MTDDSPVVLLKAYALIEGYTPEVICEVMSNGEVSKVVGQSAFKF